MNQSDGAFKYVQRYASSAALKIKYSNKSDEIYEPIMSCSLETEPCLPSPFHHSWSNTMTKKSLGLVPLDERTFEHDMAVLAKFQDFSAELLRIALIGISAIGFVAAKSIFPDEKGQVYNHIPTSAKIFLTMSLILLGLSVACSLVHRYSSTDSISWHLQAMRRYSRNEPTDEEQAKKESEKRLMQFKRSKFALAVAATSLGLAAICLAISAWIMI